MKNDKSARLRSKACWAVGRFAHARHASPKIYADIQATLADCILHDESIPVVVEAIIAQDGLINDETLSRKFLNFSLAKYIFYCFCGAHCSDILPCYYL